ncbi:major facilitator superfamily protein, partial [Plectosphaerella plurivora]
IPGTVHLVDVSGRSTGRHAPKSEHIILVPQPSDDPEDPLNWSENRKLLNLCMAFVYTLGIGIPTTLHSSIYADIVADTGISMSVFVQSAAIMYLFMGWSCAIWQPIALSYGRRGTYLFSLLLCVPLTVWGSYSTTPAEWYIQRALLGFVCGPIESQPEVTVFDLYYAHNRGSYMGAYIWVLFASTNIAPLMAGFANDAYGWRWTINIGALVAAAAFVIVYLFGEETMYFRGTATEGTIVGTVASDADEQDVDQEKADTKIPSRQTDDALRVNGLATNPYLLVTSWDHQKPFRFLSGRPSFKGVLKMMYRPIIMIWDFPCTAWAGLLYGINLAWYSILNGTTSAILSAPPYNWSTSSIGLIYIAPFLGGGVGWFWSGWIADKWAIWLARRNGGIREAEHRLWPVTGVAVVGAGGLLLWGVGADHGLHWIGLAFGLALMNFAIVAGGGIAVSYNVDCFKEIGGETMVSVMIIRNTIGFAFGYAITPWYTNMGLTNCFIMAACLCIAFNASFLLMLKWGKGLRKRSAQKGYDYLASA